MSSTIRSSGASPMCGSTSGLSLTLAPFGRGRIARHSRRADRAGPDGCRGLLLVDVVVQLVPLELELVDAVLDHVADADDAGQPPVLEDGDVTDPVLGHHLHELGEV